MSDDDIAPLARAYAHLERHRRAGTARYPRPQASVEHLRTRFGGVLPEIGRDPVDVIDALVAAAEPGLLGNTDGNFFGWVMGGSSGVGVAADMLTAAWGQNAGIYRTAPSAAIAEEVAARWLLELLELPSECSVGFTTGATMASFVALVAARSEILRRQGWDLEAEGLTGAPPVRVVVGEQAHSSVLAVLRQLGFGMRRLVRVPADREGRMQPDALGRALEAGDGPCIVVAQAGHINSGAFDPLGPIAELAHARDGWLHIDGAFGLWARCAPGRRQLAAGAERADSWAVDGHKWLQVPYDSGYAIVRDAHAHRRVMSQSASYLERDRHDGRDPSDYVPELSRRARGFASWAALQARGRQGMAELVEHHCRLASHLERRLAGEPGIRVLNQVCLNQLALTFEGSVAGRREGARGTIVDEPDAPRNRVATDAVIARVQRENLSFVAGAEWRGRRILRVSIIAERTTLEDVERLATSIVAAWSEVRRCRRIGVSTPEPDGPMPGSPGPVPCLARVFGSPDEEPVPFDDRRIPSENSAMPATRFEPIDGGCDCRDIRYRLHRTALIVHACHCRVCQRQTGTAFALNALVETDALEVISGATEIVDRPSPSGAGQRIHRCPCCRIAVWSHYLRLGPLVAFVRVGTLDDPDRCPPDVHIYTSSKQSWLKLPSEALVVPEFYRRSACWSKASQERLARLELAI